MKYYPIDWTKKSLDDLDNIHEVLSKHSPNKANQTIETLINKTDILHNHPRIGAKENALADKKGEYRYLIYRPYKIIYRVYKTFLRILRIFDTRQHPDKLQIK